VDLNKRLKLKTPGLFHAVLNLIDTCRLDENGLNVVSRATCHK